MKHENYFDEFLKEHINLNQSRLNRLENSVDAIKDVLSANLDGYRKISPQGSYAHGTIIKPVHDNDEFDADILVFIKDDDFDPDEYSTDYVKKVYDVFQNNGVYKDKSKPNSRCVTIDYVGDFHIDVVPCIEYGNSQYICNRTKKEYERTDGDGYKKWLADKNRVVGGNFLKKSIRIFKFLRDHKDNFSIKSILLTTLIGNQVSVLATNSENFCDLPTTLKSLSNRMNDFLQKHPTMPIINNPVLSEEDFNRKWDQSKYANFRDKFNIYNKKINCAFDEKDHNKSVKKWRELFGEKFGQLKTAESSVSAAVGLGVATSAISPKAVATKPYSTSD